MIKFVPEINEVYDSFVGKVLESEIISDREKGLVALAIVTAFEDTEAAKHAVMNAKQLSITNEEIGYVVSLVAALKTQKIVTLDQQSKKSGGRCC